jgi:hypothetical protein
MQRAETDTSTTNEQPNNIQEQNTLDYKKTPKTQKNQKTTKTFLITKKK